MIRLRRTGDILPTRALELQFCSKMDNPKNDRGVITLLILILVAEWCTLRKMYIEGQKVVCGDMKIEELDEDTDHLCSVPDAINTSQH